MQTSETIHPEKHAQDKRFSAYSLVGRVHRAEITEQGVLLTGERSSLGIMGVDNDTMRVRWFENNRISWETTPGVIRQPSLQQCQIKNEGDWYQIHFPSIHVSVFKDPFALRFSDKDGNVWLEVTDACREEDHSISFTFRKTSPFHAYGLGETTGFLDKNGEKYVMWNSDVYAPHVPEMESLYQSIPLLIGTDRSRFYGVFVDNPGRTVFDLRSHANEYRITTKTGGFDCYLFAGPSLKDVLRQYTSLTGRMELPPEWALGYHQSRYSYMSQEEVLEVAERFKQSDIPCDAIYLDIHYMDGYRVFTFDPIRFPNPQHMVEELKKRGIRVVPIVDPGVKKDPTYSVYQEGIAQQHFCCKLEGELFIGDVWPGESAFPDFTDEKTAAWWGEKHQFYTRLGVEGIWNDMNEPAVFNQSKTMDLDVVHRNNGNPKTHEEIHNLYGLLMSKATFEGLKQQLNGKRPFVLTRAGYAGIQRYAAVWTGDNRSFWEHMAMAMPMVLNLGLSGVPFAGPDIGGFAHHANGELLARWMQMGVFFPYCRNHSAIDTARQEPWAFGEEVEAICRTFIQLRYRLMPYLYNCFREASESGLPIMRPLLMEYPEDPTVYNLCDQFLVGRDLLVAPIYRPQTEYRSVYLPDGFWYDYWTGERLEGKRHILAHAPLDKIPLYIREGAIIPTRGDGKDTTLHIEVYAGPKPKDEKYSFYSDDGETLAYQTGAYNALTFRLTEDDSSLSIGIDAEHWGYEWPYESVLYHIHHISPDRETLKQLREVEMDHIHQVDEGWAYDPATRTTLIKQKWRRGAHHLKVGKKRH